MPRRARSKDWQNGTITWNLNDPATTNASILANGASVLVMVAADYTGGPHTPTLTASNAGWNMSLADEVHRQADQRRAPHTYQWEQQRW